MELLKQLVLSQSRWFKIDRLEHQLKDYVATTLRLFWQRQTIFLVSMILIFFYFDFAKSLFCYGFILVAELIDVLIARSVNNWTDQNPKTAKKFLALIIANTILSATAVSFWVIFLAQQQGVGGHFMPLFFLFSASLFAAMNNHQLLPALSLRLIIYGATFLSIPLYDIWLIGPDLSSELWLAFFTVLFVMFFIIDSSFSFLGLYRNGLRQLEDLSLECEKAKAADAAKSEFLAMVSHELRTPLTGISGILQLVNAGAYGEVSTEVNNALKIAANSGNQLANLVDDLLDLQKIELNKMIFSFERLSIGQLILDSVESVNGYAISRGQRINVALSEDDLFINGDKSRLMQMIVNILSNALKFSHEGESVEIRSEVIDNKICVLVEDNGVGIPEGSENQVFAKFGQLDSSITREFGGTGLGINLAKQIVERHGGTISYKSELGAGTTFCCEFDRA